MLSKCNFMKFLVMLLVSINVFLPINVNAMEYDNNLHVVWYMDDDTNLTEILRIDHVDASGNPIDSSFTYHQDYPDLILTTEIIFMDEYGDEVVGRHYTDNTLWIRSATGSGTHRVERENKWDGGTETRWASGFFTYNQNNNTVTVSNATGGVNAPSAFRITNRSTTTPSGNNLIRGRWREVEYSYTLTNLIGNTINRSVNARVYSNGDRNS